MCDASTARARRDESSARTLVARATDVDAARSPRATRCGGVRSSAHGDDATHGEF